MKEFELINHYFKGRGISRRDVELGIGDDCALVSVPDGYQLAITTDTLVSGVHFFPDIPAKALGHRVIAVNLSDLAAMGAEPAWISLGLTLPNADMDWLEAFTAGMHEIAQYYNVQIIGGDTTQGPLTVTVCAKGILPTGKGLKRSGAKVGDWIYVTGPLGDAGLAIEARKQGWSLAAEHLAAAQHKFHFPAPQVAAGQVLRGLATAAIDISDGLLADLQHILRSSGVGAKVEADKVPMSTALTQSLAPDQRLALALGFGDDYELLFTVNDNNKSAVESRLQQYGVEPVCVGQITAQSGEIQLLNQGQPYQLRGMGFEHFS